MKEEKRGFLGALRFTNKRSHPSSPGVEYVTVGCGAPSVCKHKVKDKGLSDSLWGDLWTSQLLMCFFKKHFWKLLFVNSDFNQSWSSLAGLLISQHFYLSCFPVDPLDTFHFLPGTPKHSSVLVRFCYWSGFKQISASKSKYFFLLKDLWVVQNSQDLAVFVPRLCWVQVSFVWLLILVQWPLGTCCFFSWRKTGYQELSKVMQWHLNLPLASCLLRFHQLKQFECPDPMSRRGRGWEDEYLPNNTVCWNKGEKEVSKDHVYWPLLCSGVSPLAFKSGRTVFEFWLQT